MTILQKQLNHGFVFVAATALTTLAYAQDTGEIVYDLDPFSVESEVLDAYNPNIANTGTIVAMERSRIPFSTTVLTESLISDLRIDNPADLVEQIAGVSQDENPYITDEGGNLPVLNFRVRGFLSEPLYNGFQTGGRVLGVDNIGRVEVSKGPNAVLYGQAPAGGIVNIIPKAPMSAEHASVMVGLGTNSWERATFDLGTPFKLGTDGEDNAGLRINGGYTAFERDQPFFEAEASTLASAFTWTINDRVKLDLQAEFNKLDIVPSRTAAFVSTGSGPDRVTDPYNRLRNRRNFSYSGPYAFIQRESLLSTAYLNIRLTDNLRLRLGGFVSNQDEEHRALINTFGLGTNETITDAARYGRNWAKRDTRGYKVDLLHTYESDNFSIQSLVGFEDHVEDNKAFEIQSPRNALSVSIPFSRGPIASDFPAPPSLEQFTILDEDSRDELDWTNLRFTQILSAMDDNLTFMWGVARGEGDARTTDLRSNPAAVAVSEGDDTTYTVGASYRLFNNDNSDAMLNSAIVFANYSTSFEIQAGNQQNPADFLGFATIAELQAYVDIVAPKPIDPQTGEGFEVGVRFELLKKTLNLTVTYYDQDRTNIARQFFVREDFVEGETGQNVLGKFNLTSGEENAKGVEFSFEWRANDSFRLRGDANFMDGEVVSNIDDPGEEGLGLISSPEESVSLFALYTLPRSEGSGNGFEFGLGVSYNGSTRTQNGSNNQYRVSDDYTQVRALIRYSYNGYDFALNVDNVLDEEYTNEGNWLSEDRSFKFTVAKSF